MKSFSLHYDAHYGVNKRSGWSVCYDGTIYAQLEPWLVVAVFKSIWKGLKP